MTTLVVGATGLVGFEICRQLTDAGIRVRGLVRQTSDSNKRAELERLGVQLVDGDLKGSRAIRSRALTAPGNSPWSRLRVAPACNTSCSFRFATTPPFNFR